MTRRGWSVQTVLVLALGLSLLTACGPVPLPAPTGGTALPEITDGTVAASGPAPTPRPAPGHELYGFLPYWEMDDTIADHLATTPLTTLALFSVTDTSKGAINTSQTGYKRITGDPGARIIREAHLRGVRVELVFTSFGLTRNEALFANEVRQDATIAALVALAGDLGLDGICVDVEGLDPLSVAEYGSFVGRLRDAVVAADPGDRVTVATSAGGLGATMASAAVVAGADRVFMMGYDYRVAGSAPGATSPLDRRDGDRDLAWSIELYAAAGVPPERILLGLPLYGMTWPVAGPVVGAPETGPGEAWIPRRHLDVLADPSIVPLRDQQEMVEVYLFGSDGSIGPPSPSPSPGTPVPGSAPPVPAGAPSPGSPAQSSSAPGSPVPSGDLSWTAVYVDSPATLAPKMALANGNGYAGAGFWAIGYERGLPGYTALMERFVAGEPLQ
jgi:hypothetical protein